MRKDAGEMEGGERNRRGKGWRRDFQSGSRERCSSVKGAGMFKCPGNKRRVI